MNRLYKIFIAFGTLLISISVSAQDTHYWNLQYGTRSTLLGGAVIGSVSDMAATYYNPAAVALFPKPEILLSGKVYQYSSLSMNNGAGPGKDLVSSKIEAAPSLFAGSFTFDWLGDHTLSYSILTRHNMNFGIEGRRSGVIENDMGDELVAGEMIGNQQLSDLWFGLSWAVKLSPNISIGASPYFSLRSQTTRKHAYNEIFDLDGNVSANIITQQFEYKVINLITKIGIGAKFDPFTFGISVTTPNLHLTGKGSSLVNLVSTGPGTDSSTTFIVDQQLDVDGIYHTPLSIGIGAGYKIGKHRLHLSAEWFDAINNYNVLEPNSYVGQSNGEIYLNGVSADAKSIINYGIGAEFYIKEKLWFYTSFVTDYSASIPESKTNHSVSTWDIFHLSGGVLFAVGRSEITIGMNYAFGDAKLRGPVDLPSGELQNDLSDILENTDVDYTRIKFLLGFSFELQ